MLKILDPVPAYKWLLRSRCKELLSPPLSASPHVTSDPFSRIAVKALRDA